MHAQLAKKNQHTITPIYSPPPPFISVSSSLGINNRRAYGQDAKLLLQICPLLSSMAPVVGDKLLSRLKKTTHLMHVILNDTLG